MHMGDRAEVTHDKRMYRRR